VEAEVLVDRDAFRRDEVAVRIGQERRRARALLLIVWLRRRYPPSLRSCALFTKEASRSFARSTVLILSLSTPRIVTASFICSVAGAGYTGVTGFVPAMKKLYAWSFDAGSFLKYFSNTAVAPSLSFAMRLRAMTVASMYACTM